MPVRLVEMSRADMGEKMAEALTIYVSAMGYPRGTEAQRGPVWSSHTQRPGWTAVGAVEHEDPAAAGATGALRGVAYGYRGSAAQWWGGQVRTGMLGRGWTRPAADAVLADYFELTELHVDPAAQGRRLGEALLTRLLTGRPEPRVLLSTPEVDAEDNRAWRLYRRQGFQDLLRGFTFAGDPRPFAVLARDLPL